MRVTMVRPAVVFASCARLRELIVERAPADDDKTDGPVGGKNCYGVDGCKQTFCFQPGDQPRYDND